jgi:hypothetical protein
LVPAGDADDGGSSTEDGGDGDGDSGSPDPFDPLECGDWSLDGGPATEPSAPPVAPVRFVDVTLDAGLDYRHYVHTAGSRQECIFDLVLADAVVPNADCDLTWFTAGATAGDYDGDGWVDLYVTRLAAPDLLWRNRGDGTFEDATAAAGLDGCSFSNGALFADLDRDADLDLLVSAMGGDRHFHFVNRGDGTFVERGGETGIALAVDGRHGGQGFAVGDYDLDGHLDVHVDEWLRTWHYPPAGTFGPRLLHGRGDGTFEDVTVQAGVDMFLPDGVGVFAFASAFADLDGDRWPELAVVADFRTSRLFWNDGDGTFTDGTTAAGVNDESDGMGSTFGDFDRDGRLDWFVSAIYELAAECQPDECSTTKGNGNRLYRNVGGRSFDDATDAAGVRDGGWAWGASFLDFDNDGDEDLALVNGWPGRDLNGGGAHHETPMVLWRNDDGAMTGVGAEVGAIDDGQGRGLIVLDYDRDGDLDLFVANHAGRPVLYRNDGGNASGWLRVRLHGSTSNLEGRGAVLRLRAEPDAPVQLRHLGAQSQFLGESELVAHFGLGPGDAVVPELRVYWPASDRETVLSDVPRNQVVDVYE